MAWILIEYRVLGSSFSKDSAMTNQSAQSNGWYRTRIELSDDKAIREWAQRLAVTPEKLREAASRVGNWSDDLQFELNRLVSMQ